MEFAKTHLNKPKSFEENVLWTDETKLELFGKAHNRHLKEMGMGQASAWGMASRRPLEYQRIVDAAMHCSGACSQT